jgi:D-3-phosphoglycerate dehydrogenase
MPAPRLPLVVATGKLHAEGEAILRPHARIAVADKDRPEEFRALAAEAEGLIVRSWLPPDVLVHAPHLKGIVRHGVGTDLIPVEDAHARGIVVAYLPGVNAGAVAEYAFAALLHLRRRLSGLDSTLRDEGWARAREFALSSGGLLGTTLGIVGVGAIGSRVARMATGFDMRVTGPSGRRALPGPVEDRSLDDLFSESDHVLISCPLTEGTRGLVGEHLLGRMKPDAVLVNVARGPIVRTEALVSALRAGRIAGAALDVYDRHPVPADSPLFDCPNLLMTPHAAAYSRSVMRESSLQAAAEMVRILQGQPVRNPVPGSPR